MGDEAPGDGPTIRRDYGKLEGLPVVQPIYLHGHSVAFVIGLCLEVVRRDLRVMDRRPPEAQLALDILGLFAAVIDDGDVDEAEFVFLALEGDHVG
jgi:hypothetical protein